MSKKVLILEGSARRNGNTANLSKEFERGTIENGQQVRKIYLQGLKISACLGCNHCRKNIGECVQKDDMTDINKKIMEADVVVFASPVYFYSWSAQIKAVIDRTYAIEPILKDTKFYLLSAGAAPELKYMENMTQSYKLYLSCFRAGGVCDGGVLYGLGVNAPGDVINNSAMKSAYELGKKA